MGTSVRGARTTPIQEAPLKGVRPVARPHTRRTPILRSGPQRAQVRCLLQCPLLLIYPLVQIWQSELLKITRSPDSL